MVIQEIPKVGTAVIGGSSLIGSGFPKLFEGVEVELDEVAFHTPFGPSAPFSLASAEDLRFLFVPFHGITKEIKNTIPNSAGERVFYVLMKAGVKKIIGTALCGSTNRLLDPADVVIPDDFVDYTVYRAQSLSRSLAEKGVEVEPIAYRLHQPFCPYLSRLLVEASKKAGFPRVFSRGVVGVSEGPRLESPAEIRVRYTDLGIDVVTMNLVPEVYFAREIGACYAALELVSNYGEGVVSIKWEGREAFRDFQERWRRPAAEAILDALKKIDEGYEACGCTTHRWRSIFNP
ncbi:MTAP family purine nucleoside phosphorylase [Candidatus Bathyarchaeota archaeon]|nr:MTAP family purine nucleoside phosphorylase [Candidatus Bathyarchaeota archaeon]